MSWSPEEKPKRIYGESPRKMRRSRIILPALLIVIMLGTLIATLTARTQYAVSQAFSPGSHQVVFYDQNEDIEAFALTATAVIQQATRAVLEKTQEAQAAATQNGIFITFTPEAPFAKEQTIPLALVINRGDLKLQTGDLVDVVVGAADGITTPVSGAKVVKGDTQTLTLAMSSPQAKAVEQLVRGETEMYIGLAREASQ